MAGIGLAIGTCSHCEVARPNFGSAVENGVGDKRLPSAILSGAAIKTPGMSIRHTWPALRAFAP